MIVTRPPETTIPKDWTVGVSHYPRDMSISALFERQVEERPAEIAVDWGGERLSYRELDIRANQLAHSLRRRGVVRETPVGVVMARSVNQIVTLLAICKAGGSYLPLDPTHPEQRLVFMLADAGAELAIVDHPRPAMASPSLLLPFDEIMGAAQRLPTTPPPPLATGDSRVYIMYTSGSTGTPKGVEILHRGVARLVMNSNYITLGPSDRVAQVANSAFDAFAFEVWGALLNGAQLVGLDKQTLLSPDDFVDFVTNRGLTVMLLTPPVFHFIARERPDAFGSLRVLLVGGEAMSPKWTRRVLSVSRPDQLLNVYGPTECTVIASYHRIVDLAEDAHSVPIGRPIGGTELYILDAALQPVAPGTIGQIYLGGDGLARGYRNRPEHNASHFIAHPERPGQRLYRTGDLGRWREDGSVEFEGRADDQIKIRGHRIEPGEIQAALLACDWVDDAVITARPNSEGWQYLIGYIVPGDPSLIGDAAREHNALEQLREHAAIALPAYMVPSALLLMERLPLTSNGKLDRARLPEPTRARQRAEQRAGAPLTAEERRIAEICQELLGLDAISIHDDFMALGGDSLLAARLLRQLQDSFGVQVPAHYLFESPTIAALVRYLDMSRQNDPQQLIEPERVDLAAEARLDSAIAPSEHRAHASSASNRLFLTGATGFLGAFLVRDLIATTSAELCCLVRARNREHGMRRLRDNLRRYGLWRDGFAQRITPVLGDLEQAHLGLADEEYDSLAETVSAIYHAAAHVNYVEPYSWHRAANVAGTVEIIKLACHRRTSALHHVSTLAVFGPIGYFRGVTDIHEDADLDDSLELLAFDLGYAQSKWVAEKLVMEAAERGLPVAIYRPGFIMGDQTTGVSNTDDFIARMMIGCVAMGAYPRLPRQRKEFVPVDYASAAIVHISQRDDFQGGRFHLVPPDPTRSVSVIEFFELLRRCGYRMESLSYREWLARAQQFTAYRPAHPLVALMPALTERIYDDRLTRWELYENMSRFHSEQVIEALADSAVHFPDMDKPLMNRYLGYLRRCGLLPDPPSVHLATTHSPRLQVGG